MYTFVFSVEWGLHGNQDTFCFQPAVSSLSSHCIRAWNTFVKLIVWMSAAFRTILAWIWEAMRRSEKKLNWEPRNPGLPFASVISHHAPSFYLWEVTQPLTSLTTLTFFGCLKGREEKSGRGCELCWYSVWFTSDSPTDLVTFGTFNFSEGTLLYRKGNTSLLKCCEHGINDTNEELGSFTSVATSGMRLPLGMEMASLIHLPASTVWFGDRSPRSCMKHCLSGNRYCLRFWPLPLFGGWPSRSQQTGQTCDLKLSQVGESGAWSQVIGIACPFHTLLWALDCHMADTNCPTSWGLNFVDLSSESSCLNDWDPSRVGTTLLTSVPFPVCHGSRNCSLQ